MPVSSQELNSDKEFNHRSKSGALEGYLWVSPTGALKHYPTIFVSTLHLLRPNEA
jgi:hypothetical protein